MDTLLGIAGLLFGLLITLILALCHRKLRSVLLAAFFTRVLAALVHAYVVPLPDGGSDAISFENFAAQLAKQGLLHAFDQFPGYGNGWAYPWIISLVYSITDISVLLMQSFSVIAGVGSVYVTYLITRKIWGEASAVKAAWIVALFPTLVMYSALTMREAYIAFFLLLFVLQIVHWRISGSVIYLFTGALSIVLAGLFHGGVLVAWISFSASLLLAQIPKLVKFFYSLRISVITLFIFIFSNAFIFLYIFEFISIPYIGNIKSVLSIDTYIAHAQTATRGTASYPGWLNSTNAGDYFLKLPIRFFYFLGSPFPWDISAPSHLLGLLDGLFYMMFFYLIIINFFKIWGNPMARIVLIILISLLIVHAMGTGNFGTGLRHRSKFLAFMAVLVAPFLSTMRIRF